MKHRYFWIFLFLAALVGIVLASHYFRPDSYLKSAQAGGDYLVRMQKENGKFHYLYDPARDKTSNKNYNMLRHAGTCYALFELYEATGEKRYLDTANRAVEYLKKRFHPIEPDILYVLDRDGKAKLGANGLALLALTKQAEVSSAHTDMGGDAHKLANGILLLQNAEGSFNSYYPLRGDEPAGSVSLYYPGEAILGLARLYKRTGDKKYLEAAQRGVHFLIKDQQEMISLPPDAWLMQALAALYEIQPDPAYASHAIALAETMVAMQYKQNAPAGYAGAFGPGKPRSTPATSRAEGLIAAWRLAKITQDARADKIQAAIEAALRFALSQQFTLENAKDFPKPERAVGGFRVSSDSAKIRIDYVQHAISALLGARRAFVH